jgi:hypothetical protein
VTAVSCAEPHDYEVLALVQHPAGPEEGFPGVDEVLAFAEDECLAQWEPYVGLPYERSELSAFALHPTEETWRVGDREIACLAYIEGEQLEGSVRDSNR